MVSPLNATTYDIGIQKESTFGETPGSPALKRIRTTGGSSEENPGFVKSAEVGNGPRTKNNIKTSTSAALPMNGEFYLPEDGLAMQEILEGAFRSTFSTAIDYSGTDVGFTAGTNAIAASSGSPFTDAVVGQKLYFGGAANSGNNGWKTVLTKTDAQNITVSESLTTEAAGATVTIKGRYIRDAGVPASYTVEEKLDGSNYKLINGWAINDFGLSFSPSELIKWTANGIAQKETFSGSTIDASYTAADTTDPMDGANNVLNFYEGGAVNANISLKSVNISLKNSLSLRPVVGSQYVDEHLNGDSECMVSIAYYFRNQDIVTKFKAGTESSQGFEFLDADGNRLMLTVLNGRYTKAPVKMAGKSQDYEATAEFSAHEHATISAMVQLDWIAA